MMREFYFSLIHGKRKDAPGAALRKILEAMAFLYGEGTRLHEALYAGFLRRGRLPVPVISVGNITWGGTGKTPLVVEMAKMVREMGKKPAVLTRGYGKDESQEIMRNLPGVPVGVGRDRLRSGSELISREPVDVMICDDAFQHRPLLRDWDIVAVNAVRPFGNGFLIPAGELRERPSALARAQTIVLTHVDRVSGSQLAALKEKLLHLAPQADWAEAVHEPVHFYDAISGEVRETGKFSGPAVALSGIGAPQLFTQTLKNLGIDVVKSFEFQDHHAFSPQDAARVRSFTERTGIKTVLTTEKDFLRSPELLKQALHPWILKIRLKIAAGQEKIAGRMRALLCAGAREKIYA